MTRIRKALTAMWRAIPFCVSPPYRTLPRPNPNFRLPTGDAYRALMRTNPSLYARLEIARLEAIAKDRAEARMAMRVAKAIKELS